MSDVRRLAAYIARYRLHVMGALAAPLIVTAVNLAVLKYTGGLVDEVIATRSFVVLNRVAFVPMVSFSCCGSAGSA